MIHNPLSPDGNGMGPEARDHSQEEGDLLMRTVTLNYATYPEFIEFYS
jgi:hypothetical protein